MADEEKKDPQIKLAKLEPSTPVKLKLLNGKEVATGESKFGTWNLWALEVMEPLTVFERDGTPVKDYKGVATLFPNEKLHKKFLEITEGTKVNAEITISLVPKQNMQGKWYSSYEVQLVKEGVMPSHSSLSYSQYQVVEDFILGLKRHFFIKDKDAFITFGINAPHNLSNTEAEIAWNQLEYELKNGQI